MVLKSVLLQMEILVKEKEEKLLNSVEAGGNPKENRRYERERERP